jgi:hypothetical protein
MTLSNTEAFIKALKEARLAEAAHLDAASALRDARVLRLEALRDALLPQLNMNDQARSLFDLSVQHGEKPRLWLDLISSIEMEPDPKNYRLMQGKETARECLFETPDAEKMKSFALKYCAHRLISQDKLAANIPQLQQSTNRYGLWDLVYVWFTGVLLGALGLLAVALALGIVSIRV